MAVERSIFARMAQTVISNRGNTVSMPSPIIDLATFARIAAAHGLPAPAALPTPWIGATSQVFPLHDCVLKIPFANPDAVQCLMTDSRMVHLMRNLGVETPEPLALDESLAIVPSPFALYRRVPDAEPISSIRKRACERGGMAGNRTPTGQGASVARPGQGSISPQVISPDARVRPSPLGRSAPRQCTHVRR